MGWKVVVTLALAHNPTLQLLAFCPIACYLATLEQNAANTSLLITCPSTTGSLKNKVVVVPS